MTEVTHTSSQYYGLNGPAGGSRKIFAGYLQIDDGETVDTGLDTIECFLCQTMDNVAATWHIGSTTSVSGGIATMTVGAVGDYADDTGKSYHVIAVGSKR